MVTSLKVCGCVFVWVRPCGLGLPMCSLVDTNVCRCWTHQSWCPAQRSWQTSESDPAEDVCTWAACRRILRMFVFSCACHGWARSLFLWQHAMSSVMVAYTRLLFVYFSVLHGCWHAQWEFVLFVFTPMVSLVTREQEPKRQTKLKNISAHNWVVSGLDLTIYRCCRI